MNFKLDVVIPIYYKTDKIDLLNALHSVTLNQTLKPNNILIVCDGQGCEEILEYINNNYLSDVNLIFFDYDQNKGPGYARDYAIRRSNADLIAIMDSDDLSVSKRFEYQIKQFKLNPLLALCGGFIEEYDFNSEEKNSSSRLVPLSHKDILTELKFKSPFNNVTVMFNRKCYISSGGYPHKRTSEDYALWGRFLISNFLTLNINKYLVQVNFNHEVLSRRIGFSYFKDDLSTQKEFLNSGLISYFIFCRNVVMYFLFRFLPASFIKKIYLKVLRK
ncbi:glycosyltransferase [Aliivibrio fischeri]|uniref:glycosyltransferase n=1 Tax=Aliivibrio fischeri TaxID=668 RepID=UPI0007C526C1|nr:glycosyltransferase [Aliivibrio fischeri]